MSGAAQAYPFPTLAELGERAQPEPKNAISEADEAAIKEAMERGAADGFAQGRAAAAEAAKTELAAAHAEGLAAGHSDGLAQMRQAATALTAAFDEFKEQCTGLRRQCESFCVEVALAIVERLAGENAVRAQFVARAAAEAIKVLAPEPPSAIFLNPADRKLVKGALPGLPLKDDETLAPGQVRVVAGRLLVEAGIEQAFQQIESAMIDLKSRRGCAKPARKRKR